MNIFIDRHLEILRLLLQEGVDFMVVGGYSVIYYGYKRTTGDVDLWIKPNNENRDRLLSALSKLGFDGGDIQEISGLDFTQPIAFSIMEPPEMIEFMTHIAMVSFEEADRDKVYADIDGLQLPFIHVNQLILSKINTGRAKDKADVEELQKILKRGQEKKKK
jgi:predicted nucleotidyltransferase